jgi:protein-histidine pros-kinase
VLIAVCALGLGATAWMSYGVLRANAREEVVRDARLILEATLSIRAYTIAQISPLLPHDRENFHPQTVPAYAASEMMSQIRKKYVDYSYKDAALNPMNPRNRAVGWEADIVGSFRGNPGQGEISGVRDTPAGPLFYIARPSKVSSQACLVCHTSPEVAPAAVVRMYGRTNGYGWKYQETVGAQIVSVPMSLPIHHANRTFLVLMASVAAVFAVLFVALNAWLGARVLRPHSG